MAGQTDAPPAWMIVSGGAVVLGLIGVGLGALQDWLGGTQNGPMVGGLVCGSIGFLIGFTSLRMQRDARGTACDSCHRLFRIEPANPLLPTGGVAMSAASMRAGRAGIGRRCRGCRRVVCSYCNPYRPCPCGNGRFEQIHLVYW
jgi:hypothetical protein